MNANTSCPCCSRSMLRHLSNRHSYWYCSSCRIEMPHIESSITEKKKTTIKQFDLNLIKPKTSTPKSMESIATV